MLFQEPGKMKRTWIMTSLIMMAIGITMIMCPSGYLEMLISMSGYLLLVGATVMVLDFFSSKKVLVNYVYLTGALLLGLPGLFVLIKRHDVLPVLSFLFGVVLVLTGLNDLFNAFMYTRRAGRAIWWILAILSILTVFIGLILLFGRWNSPVVLMNVIGGMMLFSSAVSIIRVVVTWPFKSV